MAIIGAAGRDFHNFNVALPRLATTYEVVAFTATQIPNIDGRVYPAELAGRPLSRRDPDPARGGARAARPRRDGVDEVVFSYSDVSHEHVMHVASRALAAGADFRLLAPRETELALDAAGASPSAPCAPARARARRRGAWPQLLRDAGHARRRAPPPDAVRRPRRSRPSSASRRYEDLEAADCTIEEREEYEPHLAEGNLVFAGVDYARDPRAGRAGGRRDPLGRRQQRHAVRPADLHLVVVDPHRPGHELRYHPGETNLRMADVCVVNKVDSAPQGGVDAVLASIRAAQPGARDRRCAASPIEVEGGGDAIAGKRVLAIEDGPTLTHGEMAYGAAVIAARQHGAAELVDPRPFAVGSIARDVRDVPATPGRFCRRWATGDEQIEELARDDRALAMPTSS